MNKDVLHESIALAQEAVKDMEDPELRKTAFEVILNKLIRQYSDSANICATEPETQTDNSPHLMMVARQVSTLYW